LEQQRRPPVLQPLDRGAAQREAGEQAEQPQVVELLPGQPRPVALDLPRLGWRQRHA
jgi:hypothetical protein